MFQVFKFVLDLLYDSALIYGLLLIINKALDVVRYFIQTQHEEQMTQLNNEFYGNSKLK